MELKMDMLLSLAVDLLQGKVEYQHLNKFLLRSKYGIVQYKPYFSQAREKNPRRTVLDLGRERRFRKKKRNNTCRLNHLNQKSRRIWLLDHA